MEEVDRESLLSQDDELVSRIGERAVHIVRFLIESGDLSKEQVREQLGFDGEVEKGDEGEVKDESDDDGGDDDGDNGDEDNKPGYRTIRTLVVPDFRSGGK